MTATIFGRNGVFSWLRLTLISSEKIPEVNKSHQERADKLRVDLPTLQAIAARTWGKEDVLKALKAELATLNPKITAELAHNKKNKYRHL